MKRLWIVAALILPLVVVGGLRLRLETDILATLPDEVPEVRALKLLRDGFTGGSDLVIALEAQDEARAEEAAENLAVRLEQRKDLVKEVRRAQNLQQDSGSGVALLAWALQNADPARLAAVKAKLQGGGAAVQLKKALETVGGSLDAEKVQRASYDPLGLLEALGPLAIEGLEGSLFGLVSEDGSFRVLLVTPATGVGNYRAAEAWLKQVKSEIRPEDGVQIRYSGEPAFQAEIGAGIEKDMSSTIGLTEVLIALLFWVMFLRLKPLLWIQGLLILSMVLTLGLGGLLVGKLSIMSLGFAAIVLGIIVDYAVLIIQEARQHPQASDKELRRLAGPGIAAGACSTATVFLSLLLSGLPGLEELGLLVALGVLVGLAVMLTCAPRLAAGRQPMLSLPSSGLSPVAQWPALAMTLALVVGVLGVIGGKGMPGFQTDAEALRPTESEAMDAFQWVQERLGRQEEASVPVLITGPVTELRARAEALVKKLDAAVAESKLVRHAVAAMLVPDPKAQTANRSVLEWLIGEVPRLEKEAEMAGFTPAATALLRGVTEIWREALAGSWPQSDETTKAASVLGRMLATGARAEAAGMAQGEGVVLASASVKGHPGLPHKDGLAMLQSLLTPDTGAWVAGWEALGGALSSLVRQDLNRQMIPVLAILVVTLLITFRNAGDLLLSVLLLGGGLAALAATMSMLGIGWNLASLAAIPLLLGTGIDYGIHILLALQRTGNDVRLVRATTGKAVFFSGMTTVIGFSSLFFAGNRGISSLGLACCVGTLWILFIVLVLLPHWRLWLCGRRSVVEDKVS